jgi:hypothetical protein
MIKSSGFDFAFGFAFDFRPSQGPQTGPALIKKTQFF